MESLSGSLLYLDLKSKEFIVPKGLFLCFISQYKIQYLIAFFLSLKENTFLIQDYPTYKRFLTPKLLSLINDPTIPKAFYFYK